MVVVLVVAVGGGSGSVGCGSGGCCRSRRCRSRAVAVFSIGKYRSRMSIRSRSSRNLGSCLERRRWDVVVGISS